MHHSPISSKRTIRTHVVGKKTANHRLERFMTGGSRCAASVLRHFALASRWTHVRAPLSLIVRRSLPVP